MLHLTDLPPERGSDPRPPLPPLSPESVALLARLRRAIVEHRRVVADHRAVVAWRAQVRARIADGCHGPPPPAPTA